MLSFLRRLWRSWDATRIRLPRTGLTAEQLCCGDWLQVVGRAWRVESRVLAPEGTAFLLAARSPPGSSARLLTTGRSGCWRLELPHGVLDVAPEELLRFPAGELQDTDD